ncbi:MULTISPECIES: hypothetical protein [Burkholderia]|uniref:hypothetical protein n=1 Tax=Burkholderia TaxID=32008 RepID=UPI000863B684|nr:MULTISPECIES: hypothetical protein [Burkholderia]AOL06210.1 hypothetical protein WI95_19605 [Burkholderia contaminans]TCW63268.1 hypothetical protein C5O79_35545 [Burkholderia sp. SRS-25]
MADSPRAPRKRTVRRIAWPLAIVAVFALAAVWLLTPRDPRPPEVLAPPGTSHVTLALSDLYMPFLAPEENADLRNRLPDSVDIVAHYTHTTTSYSLLSCSYGLGCLPDPHWDQRVEEEMRPVPARVTPRGGPGTQRTISFDLPHRLDGGYSIVSFHVTLSADALTHQPGYHALLARARQPDTAISRGGEPNLDYTIRFDDQDAAREQRVMQDCLETVLPSGVPSAGIPIAVTITTGSPHVSLAGSARCPLSDAAADALRATDVVPGVSVPAAPGRLPPGRIAAAQVALDLDHQVGATLLSGPIVPTAAMPRWYQRNDEGLGAYLIEFGPYRQLEIRMRFDNAHPVKGMMPIRTERWTYFDDALVGYTADIAYFMDTEKGMVVFHTQWDQYFHDGKTVFTQTTSRPCDDAVICGDDVARNPEAQAASPDVRAAGRDALAEIRGWMARPYDALQAEARSYLQFRSALKPVANR